MKNLAMSPDGHMHPKHGPVLVRWPASNVFGCTLGGDRDARQSKLQTIALFFFSEHNSVPMDRISMLFSSHWLHRTCNATAMRPHCKWDSAYTTAAPSLGSVVFTYCHIHQ